MFSWIAFVATLAVGPLVFAFFSRVLYRRRDTYQWPLGLLDGFGDTPLLPTFNGFAIGSGLAFSVWRLLVSFVAAALVSAWFYRASTSSTPNWSKNDESKLNAGGWWHFAFFVAESWFVGYALLEHPGAIALWTLLAAFLATGAYYFWVQLPKQERWVFERAGR